MFVLTNVIGNRDTPRMRVQLHLRPFCVVAAAPHPCLPSSDGATYSLRFIALAAVLSLVTVHGSPSLTDLAFFQEKVQPVFQERCFGCHSHEAEKIKGGLVLDSIDGWLKGGDTGPAVVSGDPEKSLLIKAIRYSDENLQMPPKGKRLKPQEVTDLEAWVKMGAPAPAKKTTLPPQTASRHWAFQPVRQPRMPSVRNQRWVQSPIDVCVLARLEARGLAPSPHADKRTLIRRAYFDLIGLPPSVQEVNQFLADQSSSAFATVVDRLLASPRFGERWGRYWLDVARYADTKGYVFEEERRYPYAYTYRDYVIDAFNADLPYDRFVTEQIAADQLPLGANKRPLAALGFLTLGRRFLNNQTDIIDDRLDVSIRGTMALTIGCARCHDHKFDPIPARDYYSLYGVFASTEEPVEKPLLGFVPDEAAHTAYLEERKKKETELNQYQETKRAEAREQLHKRAGDYLLTAYETLRLGDPSKAEALARERKLDPGIVQRWRQGLEAWSKTPHPVFAPWAALAALPEAEFSSKAALALAPFASNSTATATMNPLVLSALTQPPPTSMKEVAERYGKLLNDVDQAWHALAGTTNEASAVPPTGLADPSQESLRQVLYAADAPPNIPDSDIPRLFDVPTAQHTRALQRALDELDATHPGAPPRAMALHDAETPQTPHVFLRGNPGNLGPEVPRQFLEVIAGPNRKPFQHGSGRLEMAQAIASRNNPLTARVMANRVWLHLFGQGLVRTPSDFGLRSEPPAEPELLDYLAWQFMSDGWSTKKLIRQIMLSSVYQQSCDCDSSYAMSDPNNFLLGHMNRRRLDFEALRDALLDVTGQIDLAAGGRSVEITEPPFSHRRSIYGFIERQNLPGLFRAFDFANPDASSPQRFTTTVPQQALFMMNSPFVVDLATHLAQTDAPFGMENLETKIRELYAQILQRPPTADEIQLARRFLKGQAQVQTPAIPKQEWSYGYGQWDADAGRLFGFTALPHFTGSAWQGGDKLPDDQIGWAMLNARGGHPGDDAKHAVVRRWTAPRAGRVVISGMLKHDSEKGDGVRGSIFSSRAGRVAAEVAFHGEAEIQVGSLEIAPGETLDFVTDCRGENGYDSFEWVPMIHYLDDSPKAGSPARSEWRADSDFSGPPPTPPKPMSPWAKYAQVLLLSNELAFVD